MATQHKPKAGPAPKAAGPAAARPLRKSESTRLLVLDTAERLLSHHGYDGTSVRLIADEAGVNLGAIHYYWGTKEALCRETLERRLAPILEQRFAALQGADARGAGLAGLLDASHRPSLLAGGADAAHATTFRQFYGRMLFDPSPVVQGILASMLDPYARLFVGMVRDACPGLSDNEFYWRLTFLYGAFLYAHTTHTRTTGLWGDRFERSNFDDAATFLTRFLEGGMRAPPAATAWPAPDGDTGARRAKSTARRKPRGAA